MEIIIIVVVVIQFIESKYEMERKRRKREEERKRHEANSVRYLEKEKCGESEKRRVWIPKVWTVE